MLAIPPGNSASELVLERAGFALSLFWIRGVVSVVGWRSHLLLIPEGGVGRRWRVTKGSDVRAPGEEQWVERWEVCMAPVRTIRMMTTAGLVAVGSAVGVPVGAATPGGPGSEVVAAQPCEAWNATPGGAVSDDLQAVIDAAAPGDELRVAGTCVGGFTVTKSLVINSAGSDARAILTGQHLMRVLEVRGRKDALITVTLRGLRLIAGVAGSEADRWGNDGGAVLSRYAKLRLVECVVADSRAAKLPGSLSYGGGIYQRGGRLARLTLNDTVVRRNRAWVGGGIGAQFLRLTGTSRITGNVARYSGGGLDTGRVVMADEAQVDHNKAGAFGGGLTASSRRSSGVAVRMVDFAAVHHNVATRRGGGGIVGERGLVVLNDLARVTRNQAVGKRGYGGGIKSGGWSTQVKLKGHSSVRNNKAKDGGGLYQYAGAILITDAASVSGNVSTRYGGGFFIHKAEAVVRGRATVTANLAKRTGGGAFGVSGPIRPADVHVREDARVCGNAPNDIVIVDDRFPHR